MDLHDCLARTVGYLHDSPALIDQQCFGLECAQSGLKTVEVEYARLASLLVDLKEMRV